MGRKPIIGQRLRELIEESGLEQQQVAAILGKKIPTFSGYVRDYREPDAETLFSMAEFFNVSIDYLTGFSDIRNPYISHLSKEQDAFVRNAGNKTYIELAIDIKNRTAMQSSDEEKK